MKKVFHVRRFDNENKQVSTKQEFVIIWSMPRKTWQKKNLKTDEKLNMNTSQTKERELYFLFILRTIKQMLLSATAEVE